MKSHFVAATCLLAFLVAWPSGGIVSTAQPPGVPQIVINEIAWSGTSASSTDEWIELRSNSSRDIDLKGWTLSWSDGDVLISFGAVQEDTKEIRNSVITARGLYLLERTDDETVSDMAADLIYTGSLRNGGETLVLKDPNGVIVDTANGNGGEWPAGSDAQGQVPRASMERTDPTASDSDGIWASNDGVIRNGKDKSGTLINGTPRAENSRKKT
ncbi:MAG: hypothetical protein A2Z21_08370 [Candidatus Fraserbacteria bacterium RBG_16_55_9]|uniref:LTD domain-containing protein n=1 Tax=Fraserbacteria sp. (strain RBG_16_55_9) TaxID=1817864 RepID=A0A1F5USG2_FRAXR|nr:MAG: hypothetical protein A2Z21_08370 [Candidatus Fraserbacteria bacterium RBG_16_55_9]